MSMHAIFVRDRSMAVFYKGEEFTAYRSHVVHLNETADFLTNGRDKVRIHLCKPWFCLRLAMRVHRTAVILL